MITFSTPFGRAFVTDHADDRIKRHAISTEYVETLVGQIDEWKRQDDGRIVGETGRDGVYWRVVLQPEHRPDVSHQWDLVTVVPQFVSVERAKQSGQWSETEVLNLKIYSNG